MSESQIAKIMGESVRNRDKADDMPWMEKKESWLMSFLPEHSCMSVREEQSNDLRLHANTLTESCASQMVLKRKRRDVIGPPFFFPLKCSVERRNRLLSSSRLLSLPPLAADVTQEQISASFFPEKCVLGKVEPSVRQHFDHVTAKFSSEKKATLMNSPETPL